MDKFLQYSLTGLSAGSLYALVALGVVLIYRSTRVLNFAHGDMATLGTFVAFSLLTDKVSFPVALVLLALIIQGVVVWKWGAEPVALPFPISDTKTYRLGGVVVSQLSLATLGAGLAGSLLLYLLVQKTRLGLAMRATSENVMAAQTLGIPTRLVLSVSWGVASALGVVAGIFLAPALLLDPFFMLDPFLKGFAAAVLGGLNSLPGAVVGALILGVAESLTGAYLTIQFKNTLAFVIIIVVLLVRPEGLLGKEFKERV